MVVHIVILTCPFYFDTTKLPMVKSAELLRFQAFFIHIQGT